MPTSKVKNLLYRAALPFLTPSVSGNPLAVREGRSLTDTAPLIAVIRRNHISGGAVLLSADGEECSVYTRAFHTDQIPDAGTFFRVASITKMATALLAVRLMDLGLLDPDAPVQTLLPDGERIPCLRGIQFRHLLSHTSGISDPPQLEEMLIGKKTLREVLSQCVVREPGKEFLYSNLGFGIVGSVFEFILNRPIGQIYNEYLFKPLGMNASLEAASLPEEKIMPVIRILPYRAGTALRVTKLGSIPLDRPDPETHFGYSAGSMYTDLPSLRKLASCVRDGGTPLLSSASGFMKQEVSGYGKLSPTLSYGSGLLIVRDSRISDSPVLGHQGFAYGCVDGAFWEERTGNILLSLNGGCSEARSGRFGLVNLDMCRWAFGKELPKWKSSGR